MAVLRFAVVLAALAGAVVATPADARDLVLPVVALTGVEDVPRPVGALELHVHVPAGARIRRDPAEPEVALLTTTRGRCRIGVGVLAEAATPVRLPPGRPTSPVEVRDARGARWRVSARLSGPASSEGQRSALVSLRLPAAVLPAFPYRHVVVGALQGTEARHCPAGALDRALLRTLRSIRLRVTGDYAPDDPAPLTDVATLERLTIGGAEPRSQTGSIIESVGDTDGDGRPELAIVDQPASTASLVNVGPASGTVSLADPAAATLRLRGVGELSGVLPAGDLDGDGLADLLVSARAAENGRGAALVVLGRRGGGAVDVSQPRAAHLTIVAPPGCRSPLMADELAAPGDVDGDGVGDVVVVVTCGDRDMLWLVPGGRGGGRVELGAADGRSVALAGASAQQSGLSVAAAGDFNGDGLADLAVAGRVGRDGSRVTVVFGARDPAPVSLDEPGPRGLVVTSPHCPLVAAGPDRAGDVNGDGFADVLVAAPDECAGADAYVLFGGPAAGRLSAALIPDGRGLALDGPVRALGMDRTGDGLADLLVGGGDVVYLVAGRREPGSIEMRRLGAGGRRYRVPTGGDGALVDDFTALPDVDGDGLPELAFGTTHAPFAGRAWMGTVTVLGSRAG